MLSKESATADVGIELTSDLANSTPATLRASSPIPVELQLLSNSTEYGLKMKSVIKVNPPPASSPLLPSAEGQRSEMPAPVFAENFEAAHNCKHYFGSCKCD
jgi:hypothetical protein